VALEWSISMEKILINYFYIVAAFLLMLDYSVSFFHVISIILLTTVYLFFHINTKANGFLAEFRSICRIE